MSELLDQWTERMTRLEQAENLRDLLHIVDYMRGLLPEAARNEVDNWSDVTGAPALTYVRQGVEGMIYELEQVR